MQACSRTVDSNSFAMLARVTATFPFTKEGFSFYI